MQNEETKRQNRALIALSQRNDVLVWRNTVGLFRAMDNPSRLVRVGVNGSADILGIRSIVIDQSMIGQRIAAAFAIEYKVGKRQRRDVQVRWGNRWLSLGGAYGVARSTEDAVSVVECMR